MQNLVNGGRKGVTRPTFGILRPPYIWGPVVILNVAILDVVIPNEIVVRDGPYRPKPTPTTSH